MKNTFLLVFAFLLQNIFAQKIIEEITLPKIIKETSGLELLDDLFITHNDSGGKPILYYFSKKGNIVKTKEIHSATNVDWEDLTKDKAYFYISDSGNNLNNRKDLKIYKVPIYENPCNEENEIIYFKYPEQKSFQINFKTIYDAEGLISINEHLVIFTKNRAQKITEFYVIPKKAGNYDAQKIGSLNTESIVTGADYNEKLKLLALTTTNPDANFIGALILIKNFSLKNQNQTFKKYTIPIGKSQVEAVKIIDENHFWITSEEVGSKPAKLMKIQL